MGSFKCPHLICSVTALVDCLQETLWDRQKVNLKFIVTKTGFSSQPCFYQPVILGKSLTPETQLCKGLREDISQGNFSML